VAEKFCTSAAKSTDPADGLVGDRLVGVALLALGDLEGARRHIECMLSARQELAMPPNTTLD
jgi:hypothetical protein